MALLSWLTPLLDDDVLYCSFLDLRNVTHWATLGQFHIIPFNTVWELFPSQWNHYMHVNGRLLVHLLIQLFDGFLPKWLFALANGLIYGWLVCLVRRLACVPATWKWSMAALILVYWGIMLPLDPCISINYIWPGAFCLYLICTLKERGRGVGRICLVSVYALLCGWSNESITIGLSAAFLYIVITRRGEITVQTLLPIIAFWVGTALIVFAPGTLHRAGSVVLANSGQAASLSVGTLLSRALGLRVFAVSIMWWTVLLLMHRVSLRELTRRNAFLLCAMGAGLLFCLLIGYQNHRQFFGIELFSAVMLLHSLREHLPGRILPSVLLVIGSFAVAFHMTYTGVYLYQLRNRSRMVIERACAKGDGPYDGSEITVPALLRIHVFNHSEILTTHVRIHYGLSDKR